MCPVSTFYGVLYWSSVLKYLKKLYFRVWISWRVISYLLQKYFYKLFSDWLNVSVEYFLNGALSFVPTNT